jgi:hypothetical protein
MQVNRIRRAAIVGSGIQIITMATSGVAGGALLRLFLA